MNKLRGAKALFGALPLATSLLFAPGDVGAVEKGSSSTASNGSSCITSINGGIKNVRSGPSLKDSVIDHVRPGNRFELTGATGMDGEGYTWFQIILDEGFGWVREDVVREVNCDSTSELNIPYWRVEESADGEVTFVYLGDVPTVPYQHFMSAPIDGSIVNLNTSENPFYHNIRNFYIAHYWPGAAGNPIYTGAIRVGSIIKIGSKEFLVVEVRNDHYAALAHWVVKLPPGSNIFQTSNPDFGFDDDANGTIFKEIAVLQEIVTTDN